MDSDAFMGLSEKEQRTLKKTRLRNLKRKFAKVIRHPELAEQAIELKAEIDGLERELK